MDERIKSLSSLLRDLVHQDEIGFPFAFGLVNLELNSPHSLITFIAKERRVSIVQCQSFNSRSISHLTFYLIHYIIEVFFASNSFD